MSGTQPVGRQLVVGDEDIASAVEVRVPPRRRLPAVQDAVPRPRVKRHLRSAATRNPGTVVALETIALEFGRDRFSRLLPSHAGGALLVSEIDFEETPAARGCVVHGRGCCTTGAYTKATKL
jgi:hypothetical protein